MTTDLASRIAAAKQEILLILESVVWQEPLQCDDLRLYCYFMHAEGLWREVTKRGHTNLACETALAELTKDDQIRYLRGDGKDACYLLSGHLDTTSESEPTIREVPVDKGRREVQQDAQENDWKDLMETDAESLRKTHNYIQEQWKLIRALTEIVDQIVSLADEISTEYHSIDGPVVAEHKVDGLNRLFRSAVIIDRSFEEQIQAILQHREVNKPDDLDVTLRPFALSRELEVVTLGGETSTSIHKYVENFAVSVLDTHARETNRIGFSCEDVAAFAGRHPITKWCADNSHGEVDAILDIELIRVSEYLRGGNHPILRRGPTTKSNRPRVQRRLKPSRQAKLLKSNSSKLTVRTTNATDGCWNKRTAERLGRNCQGC